MKFLSHNGRQFRLHYVSGPIDTQGSRARVAQVGARREAGGRFHAPLT